MSRIIYKICSHQDWQHAIDTNIYHGSADDLRDGFIHFSTAEQVAVTAAKYFSKQTDLVLISFNAEQFGDALKWEPSRGGALFPHLYAALAPSSAQHVEPLPLDENGAHIFPPSIAAHTDPQGEG